jgi:hypothetical protein
VDKVRDLRVLGMATASTEGLKPAFAMTVQDDQGTVTLTFYQPEPDGEYLVTSTRRPGVFRAAMYQVEPLRVGREELIALAPPEPMEGGDAEAAADAG